MSRRLLHLLSSTAVLLTVLVACTTAATKKEEKFCTAGKYVFCRCRDRREGQKECKPDGENFGPCEPCESADNPEVPLEPGDPGPDEPFFPRDAGADRAVQDGRTPTKSCGDGVVQDGEDCDDKDLADDDGCDRFCKLAGNAPPLSSGCPGLEVHVWGGDHRPTLKATTIGSGNRSAVPACQGDASASTGESAPDRIFKVVAHKAGTLTVTLADATFNTLLYVSDACVALSNTYLKCSDANAGPSGEVLSVPVVANKSYWVFVDGATPSAGGDFRVTFAIP